MNPDFAYLLSNNTIVYDDGGFIFIYKRDQFDISLMMNWSGMLYLVQ